MLEDLPQSCPCCRHEGGQLDRAVFEDEGEGEQDDDESEYEEDDDESVGSDDSSGTMIWVRVAEGRWLVTNQQTQRHETAMASVRDLFGPLNDLDAEPVDPRSEAARKIQAIFRGYQTRNTHQAAMGLYRLFQQAYNI